VKIRQFLEDYWSFVLMCLVILILVILFCLFPPKESLLKALGELLGEIFGEVVEGFNEGMEKSGK